MSSPAVQAVKQIASLHRLISRSYEEHVLSYPIASIDLVAQPDQAPHSEYIPTPAIPVYEITFEYGDDPVPGRHACPADVEERLQAGALFWNECDFSVQTFLPSLQKQLDASVPGTRVQWLIADIAPEFVFREAGADVLRPSHSAFHVTLPGDGGRYVVDFTIEQFGFGAERWFLPLEEYVGMVAGMDAWEVWNFEEGGEGDEEVLFEEHVVRCQGIMREVCEGLD